MPAITVTVDDTIVATVSTDEYNVISVRAHGIVIEDHFVILEVAASKIPELGEATHHYFVWEHHLTPGQIVNIQMKNSGTSEPKGKTYDEFCPEEEQKSAINNFKTKTEMLDEIKQMPRLREKYKLRVELSSGPKFLGDTEPFTHGFAFGLTWDWTRPESARISLNSHKLEDLLNRKELTHYLQERVQVGDTILFQPISGD